ncbi:MAG TPA: hypothetical protein VLA21_09525, partial [Candidatus Limnocylindria bacterium]|nr:hypothetical protein [Candidatus Limnocylindria bacterium]
MKLSRIAAGLLCLTLLLGVLPLTLPASNSTASAATEVRGGSFGNPLPMKLDRRATGKISADLTVVYYEVSVPGHGQYKLESGGGLQVKAKLYRQDQSWVKTFTPDGGENGKQIESEFTISKKGKYFLAVEAASAKKTGSFTITLSAAKGAAPAATPKPTEAPVTPAPATSAPDTQAPGDRTLAVPAIKSVVQYHLQAVKVQWNAVAGAAGYGLYKSTSANGTYSLVRYVTGTETTASYLAEGTQYFFRVRAYANAGSAKSFGGYSPYKAVWVLAKPKLSAFQSSPNAARLTWPKVNEAAGYTVYRSRSLTGTYSVIGSTTSATFYTDANLAPGAYYYKVAAYRMNGAVKLYGPMSVARLVSIKTSWVPTPTPPPTQPPQTAMPPSTTDPAQPTP